MLDIILSIGIVLGAGVPIMNAFLSLIPRPYLPKWFIPKRFKGKMSPIYRLEKPEYYNFYQVRKYELRWVRMASLPNPLLLFIPFIGAFRFYRYEVTERRGQFSPKDVTENPTFDPRAYFEDCVREENKERDQKNAERNKFSTTLSTINKEFNENYVE